MIGICPALFTSANGFGFSRRRSWTCRPAIGVILGGTRGTRTPHFLEWGYRTPHFLRAVTRKITTHIQGFSTEQDTSCQIEANAADLIRTSVPEVRRLFHQVEILLRLLLVVPVTSREAERSLSSLRRLKTWLRSTLTQKRLNHVAVCNEHHDYIDLLNLKDIVNTFANCNERRQLLFGNF